MMTILLEQPVPILIVGLIIATAAGVAFVSTGRNHFGIVALVTLVVTGALLAIERFVETDREQVESALYDIAAAVRANDRPALIARISQLSPAIQQAERELSSVTVTSFSIKNNLDIMVNSSHRPALAEATFNFVVSGSYRGGESGMYPGFMKVHLRREEDGVWRLTRYEHRYFAEGLKGDSRIEGGGMRD